MDNYRYLTIDPLVRQALKVTTIYAGLSVPLNLAVGLFLAILLNQKIRGLSLYRTVYYLPSISSGVAVSILWLWIFNSDFGVLNGILARFGIGPVNWLTDPNMVIISFVIMNVWAAGGSMLIFLAGLQGIPTELYEAAEVDGANWWIRLWRVTLPLMSPVIFFNLVTGLIRALQIFTQSYIMTGGGPHNSSLFFVLYLYKNAFEFFDMGYASALAWVLFAYILALTLLVMRSSEAWVFYQGSLKGR
ncbi:MAG: sugar ABC transporter permease [Firmicutes bacterium]|nr:sugar ABC transporter permease [Bacillota bacterium]